MTPPVGLFIKFSIIVILNAEARKQSNCTRFRQCSFNENRNAPICYCDQYCMYYNDCCVDYDKPRVLLGLPKTELERRRKMTHSFCDLIPANSILGVKVISSCIEDPSQRCIQGTSSLDLADMIYVTGNDGMTYRNRQCALCNGISNFKLWNLQFLFSRSYVPSVANDNCPASVFENVSDMSSFELAGYLINRCEYRFIQPQNHGFEPRLCVRESKVCSVSLWDDENPFHVIKVSDPFTMMTLFSFEETADEIEAPDKEGSEGNEEYTTDVILSSSILLHHLWLHSNSLLTLDQLYKLVDSLFLFFNSAEADIKFPHPLFIDYIIIGGGEARLQILLLGESKTFVRLTRYTLIKKWLDTINITYQGTDIYNNKTESTYEVVSMMQRDHLLSSNYSYEVAKVRYYPDHMYVDNDSGVSTFGRRALWYEEKHIFNKENIFPSALCKQIRISFTSIQNETFSENDCVVNDEIKKSRGSYRGISDIGIYISLAMITVLK